MFEQDRKRSFRRRLPGRVGIVIDDNAAAEAAEQLDLHFREARTTAGHDVADPHPSHGDRIHIAFDENRRVGRPNRLLGMIQVIEHATLHVDRCLRRIQVLGEIVPERPPAECDHFAGFVGDREHNAPTKTVVHTPTRITARQSGQLYKLVGTFRFQVSQQRVAARRRITQSKARDRFGIQSPIGEVSPCGFAFRSAFQLPRKECHGLTMQLDEHGALLLFAPLFRRAFP